MGCDPCPGTQRLGSLHRLGCCIVRAARQYPSPFLPCFSASATCDSTQVVAPQAALWFVGVGLLGPCLGRLFNYMSVARLGAARATPLVNASPLFTTLLALVFLGEHITLKILLGMLCVVAGIAVLTGQRRA